MNLCKECGKRPKKPGKGQHFCGEECRALAALRHKQPTKAQLRARATRRRRALGMKEQTKAWDEAGNRRCPSCEQFFPPAKFKAGYCLVCGPRKKRDRQLQVAYGITLTEFEAMIEAQSGKCAICLKALTRPCMDHDHRTGKRRGILCHYCNYRLLGLVNDNDELLRRAADYLVQHQD